MSTTINQLAMLNPTSQSRRYEAFRAACAPRTRALIADCDLSIIDGALQLTIPPEQHPWHILKRCLSLASAAGKQGLGLKIIDTMFARVHHFALPTTGNVTGNATGDITR